MNKIQRKGWRFKPVIDFFHFFTGNAHNDLSLCLGKSTENWIGLIQFKAVKNQSIWNVGEEKAG